MRTDLDAIATALSRHYSPYETKDAEVDAAFAALTRVRHDLRADLPDDECDSAPPDESDHRTEASDGNH